MKLNLKSKKQQIRNTINVSVIRSFDYYYYKSMGNSTTNLAYKEIQNYSYKNDPSITERKYLNENRALLLDKIIKINKSTNKRLYVNRFKKAYELSEQNGTDYLEEVINQFKRMKFFKQLIKEINKLEESGDLRKLLGFTPYTKGELMLLQVTTGLYVRK